MRKSNVPCAETGGGLRTRATLPGGWTPEVRWLDAGCHHVHSTRANVEGAPTAQEAMEAQKVPAVPAMEAQEVPAVQVAVQVARKKK